MGTEHHERTKTTATGTKKNRPSVQAGAFQNIDFHSVFNVFAVLGLQSFVMQRTLLSHCLSLPITLKTMKNTMKINDVKGPGWPTGHVFFVPVIIFVCAWGVPGPAKPYEKLMFFKGFCFLGVRTCDAEI